MTKQLQNNPSKALIYPNNFALILQTLIVTVMSLRMCPSYKFQDQALKSLHRIIKFHNRYLFTLIIVIRKFEFVAKTRLLCMSINSYSFITNSSAISMFNQKRKYLFAIICLCNIP